ncbi:caspase family protein [Lutibacter sp.]|uniref:caspase family protein n=1 Tax=Lutibacter sp. TaxID=1925666 RepID=UPI001A1DA0AD|nr:caspase family protein [Lutibacter sp.]MBI9042219.1 caspase family protein [Lutibacter sp.]
MKLKVLIPILCSFYIGFAQNTEIFSDNFNSNIHNWYEGSDAKRTFSVRDGYYYFEHKQKTGSWLSTQNITIDTQRDYKIEATIKKISGVQNAGYGIDWGTNDEYFEFLITSQGYFSLYNYSKATNQFIAVKDWEFTNTTYNTEESSNILSITKIGNTTTFYVNNQLIYTATLKTIEVDRVGFVVNQHQKIGIDNLTVSYLSGGKNYAFNEQFSSNSNYWPTGSNEYINTYLQDGNYYFNQFQKSAGQYKTIYAPIDSYKDFEIETELTKLSGEDNSGYGLIFGRKDANNQYLFNISGTGFYRISKYDNGTYTNIIDWTASETIHKNNGIANKLTIKKENNKYLFYINDTFINEIPYTAFFGNNIGFVAFTEQKFAVNYVTIQYLDGKKDVIVTNNNTSKDYIMNEDFNNNNALWISGNSENYNSYVANGKYHIEHKRETGGYYFGKNVTINQSRDFEIETTLERKTATNTSLAFVFGKKDDNNKYEFFISNNGSYLLRKYINGEKTIVFDWTESPYIATGTAANRISIRKNGNQYRFFINNQYLDKIEMNSLPGTSFGWVIYDKTILEIDDLKIKYLQEDFNNPPEIEIIEPEVVSRGFKIVKTKNIQVKGKATDKDGIYFVKINDIDAYVAANGDFNADVPLKFGDNELVVTASDIKGKTTTKKFYFKRESPVIVVNNNNNDDIDDTTNDNIVTTNNGEYYALLIGVSDYGDAKIVDLEDLPNKDAEGLATILKTFYNFKPENVKVLVNAKRVEILNAFDDLRKKLTDEDNLLIFYAGHGVYEEDSEVGYWLPSDAEKEYTANWIQNSVIVSTIKRIKSKHTLLISDACFSGSIFKSRALTEDAPLAFKKLYELPSKKAITSGTLKTVPNKSVFYKYLTDRLKSNNEKYMSALDLFSAIKTPVANNSSTVPQYGVIHGIGDEGGDFIFIKK